MRSSEAGTGRRTRGSEAGNGRRSTYRLRDRGAVTAEAAVMIPVLVAFVMVLLWALVAASAQIRCVDAARAGARAAARSEPEAAVLTAARDAAPRGSRVAVGRAGELWRVTVETPAPGPAALALMLRAEAVALAEDTVGGAVP
ncbi:TadE family type IV pilus minor pilin [Streptomyces sp. CA-146814]|uniref:TadE family type IV pilus minor pilin n=1 Tax=Streptomyces sp. CA-146814 TaxID=3240053 RepID=UPI003D92C285